LSNNIENYLWTTGTSTAYVVNSNSLSVFSGGQLFFVKIHIKNTGSSTLDINGTGPRLIKKNGSNLVAGELILNSLVVFRYVASADNFEIDRVENFVQDTPLESAQVASALGLTELELSYLEGVESNIQDQIDALGGASAPSGTGFVKVTSGVYDTPGPLSATDITTAVQDLQTSASPQFAGINLGHASDTTLARSSAGVITVEGVEITTNTAAQTLTNKTLTAPKLANGGFIADANGNEGLILATTASAVNEVTLTPAATGNAPKLAATGGDTNINLQLAGKGSGGVAPQGTGGTGHFLRQETANGVITSSALVPGDMPTKAVLEVAGAATTLGNSGVTLLYGTPTTNTCFTYSAGTWTCTVAGRYRIEAGMYTLSDINLSQMWLLKNGTQVRNGTATNTGNNPTIAATIDLGVGDIFLIKGYSASTPALTIADAYRNFLCVTREL
jgi:hypothetical protein